MVEFLVHRMPGVVQERGIGGLSLAAEVRLCEERAAQLVHKGLRPRC